jgi:hypothetical protein
MKIKGIIITIIMIPILTIIDYIGDLRCQEISKDIITEYQPKYVENRYSEGKHDGTKDDKNAGVEILAWIIKRNLYYKYSKLDPEELEAMLEK